MKEVISTITEVKKRNGETVFFDIQKIFNAIKKAVDSTGEFNEDVVRALAIKTINLIQQLYNSNGMPTVENIQDCVEEVLLASPFKRTAKAYIIYRDQHAKLREFSLKSHVDFIDSYLNKTDWQVNENSNMSYSLQGLNNYLSSEQSKIYWLNKIYPDAIKEAHIHGDFHVHDLGLLSVYCVGWDLYDLLLSGFTGAVGKIESKPAKHFRSALGQIVNFFYTLQGEAAGAQAFSNFDTLLAPFIHYDNLSYKEVKQAIQEFLFNVNIPTRVGFQTPFTNITLDLTIPSYYADKAVIIGGEMMSETYAGFQNEVDTFNKALLEVMKEGDAKGRVFTFPIPTYNLSKDFDWDNPMLDILWEITAKYGIPYFANYINSDMKPEDARSMCCRLRIDNRELNKRGGGLFGASPLTGSIGVVTINLPRLGFLSKDEHEFFSRLGKLMNLAKEGLEIKRKVIERFMEQDLYPYMKFYLRNVKERFDEYWKNHFSTIGLVGMNEACINLLGDNVATEEGQEFANRVMNFMRDKLVGYQKETGSIYNLEATPAEGTSYRLALLDKKMYPQIICANESTYEENDSPFYTNSSQLPVNYTDDLFEMLDLQDELQSKYTGGTVQHLYIGERMNDHIALKELIKTIAKNYRLPYFSITPTFSVCPVCGYLDGEHSICPDCQRKCEIYSRVVGYLRPVEQWNKGKRAEYEMREMYKV